MSGLHSRQRQHRRQNSTPSAFDAVKIAPLPNLQQRRPISHRRGLSLDTRGPPLAPAPTTTTLRREYIPVGISAINPGPAATSRHAVQKTQQQRTARPVSSHPTFAGQDGSDTFLLSPQVTPQSRRFTTLSGQEQVNDVHGLPFDPYSGSLSLLERSVNRLDGSGIDPSRDFEFFGPDSALSTPSFMTFPESSPADTCQGWISETETASTHSRRSSRRISNGMMDKISKFEAMGSDIEAPSQRPCTPVGQTANDCFPQTPVEIKQESTPLQPPNRFSEGYDESMEVTLKPIRNNKTANRNSGNFQDFRQQAEAMAHTPPRPDTIPMALSSQGLRTPEFMNMRNISAEFRKIEREFGGIATSPVDMPGMFSFLKAHEAIDDDGPDFHPLEFDFHKNMPPLGPPSPISKTPSCRSSSHRRTESIASITSAASIADINIEETKTDTGVTLDDIAAFIQGPDPSDGKWRCLYDGCDKSFGRKENIKSHVQTHLNDRQYQCPSCKKCFVRQHDLKRHAKIHTGIKPYPCECGNSFARHDALTRHRQRGMCIGAFDGVVRKVVKRGRPKKIRPDMDERRDKAERTRRKNKLTSANSASSQSGYSDISGANSPSNDFDGLLDDDHFPGIMTSSIGSLHNPITTTTMNAVSTAPIPTTITGTMAEVFHAMSPSAMSNYSHASHTSHASTATTNHLPTTTTRTAGGDYNNNNNNNPPSPTKSVASHYTHTHGTTPPDLSSPRSPPPLLSSSTTRFFDLDQTNGNTSCLSEASSIGLGTTAAAHAAAAATPSSVCGGRDDVGGGFGAAGSSESDGGGGGALEMLGFHVGDGEHHHHHHHQHQHQHLVHQLGGHIHLQLQQQQQQQQQQGLMMKFEKFEDEFDAVSMFTHGEDVFFGTA
ncbi:hypothetical protein C8A00DRAFT_18282 [Chaetomidium leptoderma]|uniref:C2H2-type domain-containing protein n=1 Tax=Chaetomidium leptoderma TaxID=669021 RepID=A0AAN6VF29_9PEZI|nr:hypothetical protein C8A00DRAFT_18282 [Chaetomidium leptoderma]